MGRIHVLNLHDPIMIDHVAITTIYGVKAVEERILNLRLEIGSVHLNQPRTSAESNLLASERSERDTYRGNTIENRGYLFIYLFIYLYICLDVRM